MSRFFTLKVLTEHPFLICILYKGYWFFLFLRFCYWILELFRQCGTVKPVLRGHLWDKEKGMF